MHKHISLYGVLATFAAHFLWGLLPIYWKHMETIPADEIVAHRIIWSCLFMYALVAWRGKLKGALNTLGSFRAKLGVFFSAVFITINWALYVWAVNSGHVIDSSLGYYINPIISVFFGALILRERIGWEGVVALIFAIAGCGILIVKTGVIPWIALVLALTFALYGLLKKTLPVDAETGLFLETAILAPFAITYLVYFNFISSRAATLHATDTTLLLLLLIGPVTAAPLLLFGIGARLIDLSLVGFLQYISPTITLILGVFVYNEAMTKEKLAAFALVWIGLAVFTVARIARGSVGRRLPPAEEPL